MYDCRAIETNSSACRIKSKDYTQPQHWTQDHEDLEGPRNTMIKYKPSRVAGLKFGREKDSHYAFKHLALNVLAQLPIFFSSSTAESTKNGVSQPSILTTICGKQRSTISESAAVH